MVYESDFYTVRRPYSRPTITSYTITGCRPVITLRTLIPPSGVHSKVRMSVLLGELNRIQHRPRPRVGCIPSEDYLCSRPLVAFDDETKLIRAQADRLMKYIYTRVPTRERHQPIGVLTAYERHYTPPDERYSSPRYLSYHRDIPSNIVNMSYYYEPSRVSIGRGHLACVSYAGGRGYPKRKHLYSDENRDIGDEIKFRSYYNKIINPKRTAEALLLPTGFASRLLLTDRNIYGPREDGPVLFNTPIKRASGVTKVKKLNKESTDKQNDKPRKTYTKTTSDEPIVVNIPTVKKQIGKESDDIVSEYKLDLSNKKPRKESKEDFNVETVISAKAFSKSPERIEDVECTATVVRKSKEPEPAPEPAKETEVEPEVPKEEIQAPEPEVEKPAKKSKKESKKKDAPVSESVTEVPTPNKEEIVVESAVAPEPENIEVAPVEPVTNEVPSVEPVTEEVPPVEPVAEELPPVKTEESLPPAAAEETQQVIEDEGVKDVPPIEIKDEAVEPQPSVVEAELTHENQTPLDSQPEEIKSEEIEAEKSEMSANVPDNVLAQTEEIPIVEADIPSTEEQVAEPPSDALSVESPVQEEICTTSELPTTASDDIQQEVEQTNETEPEPINNTDITEVEATAVDVHEENLPTSIEGEGTAENEPIIEEPQSPCENIDAN